MMLCPSTVWLRRRCVRGGAEAGHPVYALETFVDRERFRSACYRAAPGSRLGASQGPTRKDRAQHPRGGQGRVSSSAHRRLPTEIVRLMTRMEALTGCTLRECPQCHGGRMVVVELLPRVPNTLSPIMDSS